MHQSSSYFIVYVANLESDFTQTWEKLNLESNGSEDIK